MSDEQPSQGALPDARPPDAYEAKYMTGALYRDKSTAPLAYHLLFLLPVLIVLVSAVLSHAPLAVPVASTLAVLLPWVLFASLRISVTNAEVHVQYGLFGPKIPVASITSCEAVNYDWKQYGGWGIRYGKGGSVAYNMLGDAGRAVRVTWTKGKKTKTVLLSSRDPERLAAAINQARASAPRPTLTQGERDARLRFPEAPQDAIEGAQGEEEEEAEALKTKR